MASESSASKGHLLALASAISIGSAVTASLITLTVVEILRSRERSVFKPKEYSASRWDSWKYLFLQKERVDKTTDEYAQKRPNLDPAVVPELQRATSKDHSQSFSQTKLKSNPFDSKKREHYLSWDDYFMAVAFLSAQRSKDPNRQVGACVVNSDHVILGIGYNGFPRGIHDDDLPWAKASADGDPLKTKYPYVCHAEVNAILNRNSASVPGQRIYVTMFPCNECAKLIIQARIVEVVYFTDKGGLPQAGAAHDDKSTSYAASRRLLAVAGVKVWQHQPMQKQVLIIFD